ncbi:COX15/CtaA family protein [Alicyclobacillus pomorum]|uniref:COX15/CtaA family protein n=1 Tax=Alicyclobacillus pomorum TaxID=204470 RepID=UPI000419A5DB|nr:COX15/CtaA family protein [Alicyclobacillus pomorum]
MSRASSVAKKGKVYWLSVATLILLFLVNMMGFVDTDTNSSEGLGRSWPFSSTGILPAHWQQAAAIEFTHRALVFVFMVSLVTLSVWAWRRYGAWIEVKVLISIAVLFVLLQAALGAMAVLFVNPPAVTATHMGVSLLSFGAVLTLTQIIGQIDLAGGPAQMAPLRSPLSDTSFVKWAWFTLLYLLVSIYFGAYVSSTGAGGRFQGWPLPTETYQHAGTAFIIDVVHRSLALGLIVLFVLLTVKSYRMRAQVPRLFKQCRMALILACLQAVSGALLIYTELSLTAFLIHVSIVTFMFGTVCSVCVRSLPELQRHVDNERVNRRKSRRVAHV